MERNPFCTARAVGQLFVRGVVVSGVLPQLLDLLLLLRFLADGFRRAIHVEVSD